MDNTILDDIKQKFVRECQDKGILWTDALLYMIFNEYPIGTIDDECGSIQFIKDGLKRDYEVLWDMQPAIEEDEDKAFAIQHARDIYDVLLDRTGGF